MKIFYLLGLIMIGFSILIISLPEYHSITEISDNNTFLKINSCNEMHSLDDDSKQSLNSINFNEFEIALPIPREPPKTIALFILF